MKSAYIHIPFCNSICSYCDFCKYLYNDNWITKYLESLSKEIKDKYNNEVLDTIYIGGGTPSSLNNTSLKYLLDILSILNKSDICEYTFEMNLNDITEDKLSILKTYGINRLSIGIESFNKDKLLFMERNHTLKDAKDKISLCRKLGFNNINVDLIYGIPNETLKVLKKDLKDILSLKVEHISTYSLIIEDNTKIGINKVMPISEELDSGMYKLICNILKKNDYKHYEVSNFSKEGYESNHNLTYWHNNEYYGFGCGAHGYIEDVRYENTRSITKYINNNYIVKEELLSKEDRMYNEVMLGLRLLQGINLQEFYDKYEINLQEKYNIKPLLEKKLLVYKNGYLFIPENYIYVMNEILLEIL